MSNPASDLHHLFRPSSIAVIGASTTPGSVGYSLFSNLKVFPGKLYAINPKRKRVQGVRSYHSLEDIPCPDLVVIATPAFTVPSLIEQCGKKGVKAAVIISAGFMEVGKEGVALGKAVQATALRYGIRILGPNCLGFMCPSQKINASFGNIMPLDGSVAFISQSGALGTAILDWAYSRRLGFRYFVSVGSMIDIGFDDLIDYFGMDPKVSSILIYLESISKPRAFMSAARAFARNKPIIVLKAGGSDEGANAARSHTGALAGNDAVFDAAFKRCGIIRVRTVEELFHTAEALALQPRPKGNRLAIVTNAGGPGVLATDTLIGGGGRIAKLSQHTLDVLNASMPPAWSHGNPIDILGDAPPNRFVTAVQACIAEPDVDGIIVLLTPQAMTDPTAVAQALVACANTKKTVLASWIGGDSVSRGKKILEKAGIPVYGAPESAVNSFLTMHQYHANLELLQQTPEDVHLKRTRGTATKHILQNALNNKRNSLFEYEAKEIFADYGLPVPKTRIATSAVNAVAAAKTIGYPLVMKIVSPQILHKTDAGCVKLNINSPQQVRQAFRDVVAAAHRFSRSAHIEGVLLEKMNTKPFEVLIGAKKDPIFGPIIMFGMGGTLVELYKDVAIELPPLNMLLARRLIEQTKIAKLLTGYRGAKGANMNLLCQMLIQFSQIIMDHPEIQEIEINPLALDHKEATVLDARILLGEKQQATKPYMHMVISPYPAKYVKRVILKKGKKAILRPIRPEDEGMMAELFTSFSKETQRFRFFNVIKSIDHDMLVRFTQIDYDRELALVAELVEGKNKRLAGVVRYVADSTNTSAEFSVVVGDPWRGLGIGKIATDQLLSIAKQRGIKKIYASLLTDNLIMIKMFKKRGFSIRREKGMLYAEKEL